MDLKNFANSGAEKQQNTLHTQPNSQDSMNERDVRRAINHFGKMSNDQLAHELTKHLSKKKAQGREGEVIEIIDRIKPFLNAEQQKRLNEIMENFL